MSHSSVLIEMISEGNFYNYIKIEYQSALDKKSDKNGF